MKKNYVILSKIFKKLLIGSFAISMLALHSCSDSNSGDNFTEETIKESTKGVITELEEIPPGDDYKILDEKIIEDKSKSMAIVHRLNGKTDTVQLAQLKDQKTATASNNNGLRNVLLFGLAASFLNRNMSRTSPNSSVYKNADTYNRSAGLKNNLSSSATSRTIRVPGKSRSGFGSGKSFRSHGG